MINKLKIINIIEETSLAKTFQFEPLDGWEPSYKAGQFITLVFDTKYGEKRRSYSISSVGLLGEPLSITVKNVENGEFSRLLLTKAKVGDILYTSGIYGLFVLPEELDKTKQLFFLVAGSGITPCLALIKSALLFSEVKIVLIYSNRNKEDAIFYEQLITLQNTFAERLTIRFLFSNVLNVYHSRLSNWLLQQLLKEYQKVPNEAALFYLCGPFDYMRTVNITLLGASIPAANIIKENFSSFPRLEKPKPPDLSKHNATIHFHLQRHVVEVQYPLSILAAAKKHNIQLPYSCEAGRCGSCVATCVSGKTWMAYNEVLTDEEVAKGRVLTCQAYPINGDVEIVF